MRGSMRTKRKLGRRQHRWQKGKELFSKINGQPHWQIRYWNGTHQIRESTHTTDRKEALELLQKRLGVVTQHGGGAHQVTINALLNLLLKDYRDQDRASLYTTELRVEKHVRPAFGKLRASKLTTGHVREYKEMRRAAGAAPANNKSRNRGSQACVQFRRNRRPAACVPCATFSFSQRGQRARGIFGMVRIPPTVGSFARSS